MVVEIEGRLLNGSIQEWDRSLVSALATPAILMGIIWCGALLLVAVGPIDYPGQPSWAVLTIVVLGVAIFVASYQSGRVTSLWYLAGSKRSYGPSARMLNRTTTAASLCGIVGIALIALDRIILSGVSNSSYAELLRCAPGLVDTISIRRTPLLYGGYALFSFGFVSIVVFLLRGEEIRGWAAALAQFSIVSPVGYALLYSGRMPILFVLVLVAMAMLVRRAQGRSLLPPGHHLLLKTATVAIVFLAYSSSVWTTRQNFCIQMSSLITELQQERDDRAAVAARAPTSATGTHSPKSVEGIAASSLNRRVEDAKAVPPPLDSPSSADAVLAMVLEAWKVKPRGYVIAAIEASHLPARGAMIGLGTYFYLTHGVRTIDIVWSARDKLTPQWGVYEIGVLSPLLRIFFPSSDWVAVMEAEQSAAMIFGFFPSVWGAAFIDFGLVGAIIYVVIWGGLSGWSAAGSRSSSLMTPQLLLVFSLASVLLSPIQGPLGIANSALVLVSMLITGLVLDFIGLRSQAGKLIEDIGVDKTAF